MANPDASAGQGPAKASEISVQIARSTVRRYTTFWRAASIRWLGWLVPVDLEVYVDRIVEEILAAKREAVREQVKYQADVRSKQRVGV